MLLRVLETSKLQDVYYIIFFHTSSRMICLKHILEKIRTTNFPCKRNVVEPVYLHTGITTYFCCNISSKELFRYSNNATNSTKYTVISWFIL